MTPNAPINKKFAKVEIEHPVFKEGTIGEKVALIGLCLYAWPTAENRNLRKFKVKQSTLANTVGVHRKNLIKSLAGLKDKGFITTYQNHPRATTEYTVQWKDKGGKYGLIPLEVLNNSKLNPTAKLVYLALSAVVNVNTGLAMLSWNQLVQMVGVSRRGIPEAIKRLTETEILMPVGTGGNTGDIYQMNLINDEYIF